MKYTYRLLTNPEMTTDEKEFVTGLLQAFELSPVIWTRIEDDWEIPEISVAVGTPTICFSMFGIGWSDQKIEPAITQYQDYTAGSFGESRFFSKETTHYFKHEAEIIDACHELPSSKGFFPSLRRTYSTDTPNQFGYAVGCALNDLMFVESIYEEREEQS